MSWKIQLNSSNNLAQLANNIHPGSDRHITNMARTHDTRPRAMEIIYLSTNHGHNQSYLYHKYYKNSNESCSLMFWTNFISMVKSVRAPNNIREHVVRLVLGSIPGSTLVHWANGTNDSWTK